jgi:hypothetical protein
MAQMRADGHAHMHMHMHKHMHMHMHMHKAKEETLIADQVASPHMTVRSMARSSL